MPTSARWADYGDDDLLVDHDAAALLRVSVHTARAWRAGKEPRGPRFVRVGSHVRYRIADLKEFVRRNTAATLDDPEPAPPLRRVG